MRTKLLILTAALLLGSASQVFGQIPQVISYQGYLTSGSTAFNSPGVPVTLNLYDDASSGKLAWSHTYSSVPVVNGYYSIIMNFAMDWQNGYATFDHQYWLSANVNSQLLSPRVQFTAAPYSFNSRIADSAIHIPQAPVGTIVAFGGSILKLRGLEKKLGWYVCDGRRIPVDSFPAYVDAVGSTYGVSDATDSVYLPDFRALFLRGVDGGMTGPRPSGDSLRDPDESTRGLMRAGANQGNTVGSIQNDAFQGHWHTPPNRMSPGNVGVNPRDMYVDGHSVSGEDLVDFKQDPIADNLHGKPKVSSESRPKNAYVYWIIKVK